jgi:RNA polymerase sigma-70 factor (ECF subfamily)
VQRAVMMAKKDKTGDASVVSIPWQGDDEALLSRLREGSESATLLFYERFSEDVSKMIWRLLGPDAAHEDLINDVFVKLLLGIKRVKDGASLRAWVLSVTVNTVRSELRKRAVRRRFSFGGEAPEPLGSDDHDARDLLSRAFAVLERLPVKERIAFCLRYVDGHHLVEVAELCDCSLATAKRRIRSAEQRFSKMAKRDPELHERLLKSGGWGQR